MDCRFVGSDHRAGKFLLLSSTKVGAAETAVEQEENRGLPPAAYIRTVLLAFAAIVTLPIGGCGEGMAPSSIPRESAELTADEKRFAEYLKKAQSGESIFQHLVASAYENGSGVAKNLTKAAEWHEKAAVQGDAASQTRLGTMYRRGEGVVKDPTKAFEWYAKASGASRRAEFFMGLMLLSDDGMPSHPGNNWLGQIRIKGAATPQMIEFLKEMAAEGDGDLQLMLGVFYEHGFGVTKDAAKAAEWIEIGAAKGEVLAQESIGLKYAKGEGVVKDIVLAYAWFNIAATSGSKSALKNRDIAESRMSGKEVADAQGLSSNWKNGQILARGSNPPAVGGSGRSSTGGISKRGTGTAFVVSKTGHAITNQHVTNGCVELRIEGRDATAKLVTDDKVNDLALIHIQGAIKDAATISAEPGKLRQGDEIVVFGFPLNSVLSSGGNLTPGVVSALTGLGNNTNQTQITASIQPGSSGSPVMNRKGEVVGVVSMKLDDSKMAKATGQIGQNVNFAVSGLTLKTFLDTNKVAYANGGSFFVREKSSADIADEARKWSFLVECWR